MSIALRDEIEDSGNLDADIKIPQMRYGLWGTRVLAGILIAALFGTAIVGLKKLVGMYEVTGEQAAWQFFLAVDLLVIPLLLMGIILGASSRYLDRLLLATSYQERLNKLQSRLNLREDLLRLIADHQMGAISIFDHQNRYWYVNKPAADKLGKTAMEIIGKTAGRVLGLEKARQLEVRLAEARAAVEGPISHIDRVLDDKKQTRFIQYRYLSVSPMAEMADGVIVSEEDLTSLIVERERRESMLRQVIDTLVAVVDRRDPYAAGHSSRVGQLAHAIAEEMDLDAPLIEAAETAGSLMNFGKVLVSRQILTKTSALTPEELQRVRDSILVSADILAIIGFEGPVVPTLRQVLERFDGSGVPEGLKGDAILVTARIVAAANAFVALVSPRAHRDGLSLTVALESMMKDADKTYDRRVLIALSNYIENRPNKLDWLTLTKQG